MPDYMDVYGWMKHEGTRGIGTTVGHNEGWDGEHPISSDLHEAFAAWQNRFERAELSDNGRIEDFDWEAFHQDGIALARRLKAELGDLARVIYEKPAGDPKHHFEERREVLADGELPVFEIHS